MAGDNVTFNDSNNGHYNVTLNAIVSPGSVTVDNTFGNYVISGTGGIAGTGGLTKSGSSTLTLSTVNTYTGATIVNAGTLVVGANGALPANNALTINGSAAVQLADNTGLTTLSFIAIASGAKLDIGNNHVIFNSSAITVSTIAGYIAAGYAGRAGPGLELTVPPPQ